MSRLILHSPRRPPRQRGGGARPSPVARGKEPELHAANRSDGGARSFVTQLSWASQGGTRASLFTPGRLVSLQSAGDARVYLMLRCCGQRRY